MSDPIDELQWSSPEWIQTFGLNFENVLEYFAQSPFYDRSSNNQILKMQYQFNPAKFNITQTRHEFVKDLKRMVGTEFIVHVNNDPHFYIIRKQNRISPQQVQILHDYYIINSRVYMAHDIFSILNSRLLNCTTSFKKSFSLLNELNTFSTESGHQYLANDISKNIRMLEKKIEQLNNNDVGVTDPTGSEGQTPIKTPSMRRGATNTTTSTPLSSGATPGLSTTTKQARPSAMFDKLLNITLKDFSTKLEKESNDGDTNMAESQAYHYS